MELFEVLSRVDPVLVRATKQGVRDQHKKLIDDAVKAKKLRSKELRMRKVQEINKRYNDLVRWAKDLEAENEEGT